MKGDHARGYTRGHAVGYKAGLEDGEIFCSACRKRYAKNRDKRNIDIAIKRNQELVGSFHHSFDNIQAEIAKHVDFANGRLTAKSSDS